MSDNRSFEERVKDFRKMVENAPSPIREEFLPAVERAEKLMEQRRTEIMKNNCVKIEKVRKQKGMIVKKIELEMCFADDFVPPEKFDKSLCSGLCPFLAYEPCDTSDVFCCVTAVRDPSEECPIKKFFN